jgi:hypothetical protein
MNGLLAAMAVANPAITALLTIIVFLEKNKLRKRSEDLEAALNAGNQAIVRTIEAQKQEFMHIADRLEALSKDSEKSAATFIGLSTALTESSAVSGKALGAVTEGIRDHANSVSALVTDLSKYVSETNANAITTLGEKASEAIKSVAQQVGKVEAAQIASKDVSTQAISEMSLANSNAIATLGDKASEAIKSVAEQVGKVEAAQIASKDASTLAISDLSLKNSSIIELIGDEVKKVGAAQIAMKDESRRSMSELSLASSAAITALGVKASETIKVVAEEVINVEAAQIASKEASTQAIAELSAKTQESLKIIGEEIRRVEVAQAEAARAATESVAKLAQEIGLTSKSIKELQETLKSTVTL